MDKAAHKAPPWNLHSQQAKQGQAIVPGRPKQEPSLPIGPGLDSWVTNIHGPWSCFLGVDGQNKCHVVISCTVYTLLARSLPCSHQLLHRLLAVDDELPHSWPLLKIMNCFRDRTAPSALSTPVDNPNHTQPHVTVVVDLRNLGILSHRGSACSLNTHKALKFHSPIMYAYDALQGRKTSILKA